MSYGKMINNNLINAANRSNRFPLNAPIQRFANGGTAGIRQLSDTNIDTSKFWNQLIAGTDRAMTQKETFGKAEKRMKEIQKKAKGNPFMKFLINILPIPAPIKAIISGTIAHGTLKSARSKAVEELQNFKGGITEGYFKDAVTDIGDAKKGAFLGEFFKSLAMSELAGTGAEDTAAASTADTATETITDTATDIVDTAAETAKDITPGSFNITMDDVKEFGELSGYGGLVNPKLASTLKFFQKNIPGLNFDSPVMRNLLVHGLEEIGGSQDDSLQITEDIRSKPWLRTMPRGR